MDRKKVTVFVIPGQESGYVAFFPFFPSCTTQGETLEETLRNAKEALEDLSKEDLESLDLSYAPIVVTGQLEVQVPVKQSKARLIAS